MTKFLTVNMNSIKRQLSLDQMLDRREKTFKKYRALTDHHRSFTPEISPSSPNRRLKHRSTIHHRPSSSHALTAKPQIEFMNNANSNRSSTPVLSTESMTINESTKIDEILCFHLPTMANDYFQYCNSHSQANKSLQNKIDSNEQFRSYLKIFQDTTGGLSLNGYLTKPIQRVTRYPLLIEKILKHTPNNHPDYLPIKQALESARQLTEKINKQISEQESSSRLDWLQQHLAFGNDENSSDGYLLDGLLKFNSVNRYQIQRQLLLHGVIMKVPGGKELLAFLFNNFLLFTIFKSSSSNWQTQIFEQKSNL
ncbi:unnamed protein product [Didymodactylos carnosus]|uniref:DH domain-containing protein n=1 Tax=Didymodactylos carnosus TaxID=1234261 RepID=A0A814TN21_9BILA|nr:unnamed protein product [Didymodactylos carnosus]CAF1251601.1 unnamed protein product [Didymodactylos carnosus]CAF3925939.1 unnamed protein product [Didymodactylos carnosus]CAF4058815.1 unnamed protein product [Didymodactylos carnosus]